MTATAKDRLRRLVDIAKESARLELEGEAIIAELAPVVAPGAPSRSVQRRVAVQQADPPPPPGTTLADRIAGMLQGAPSGISIAALCTATGAAPKSVRATLSTLKTRGRAAVVSRGVWGVPC
jgi:hypothetical protein